MSSITKEEFRQARSEIHDINKFTQEVIEDIAFIRLRHKTIKPEHLIARLARMESRVQRVRTRNARIDGFAIDLVEAGDREREAAKPHDCGCLHNPTCFCWGGPISECECIREVVK